MNQAAEANNHCEGFFLFKVCLLYVNISFNLAVPPAIIHKKKKVLISSSEEHSFAPSQPSSNPHLLNMQAVKDITKSKSWFFFC